MGKLSAFWLASLVAGAGTSAVMAAQPTDYLSTIRLQANSRAAAPAAEAAKTVAARNPYARFRMNPAQKVAAGYGKMDNVLAGVAEMTAHGPRGELLNDLRSIHHDVRFVSQAPAAAPYVLVDIHVKGDSSTVKSQLEALGAQHISQYSNVTSAYIPTDRLKEAAALDGVGFMRSSRATKNTGSVEGQGDIIQNSYALRAEEAAAGFPLDGTGISVGVLSDSFACVTSPTSYADDVASGDLPANVTVLEEYNYQIYDPSEPQCFGATDEGRAIEQIVYDVAPGATLMFNTGFNGEADFARGIEALATHGATVIDDDLQYFDEPTFQDGILAKAVDKVNGEGVAYFSSAGNNAHQSYEASWADSGTVGASGADNAGEKLMQFTSTDGTVQLNYLPIGVFQAQFYLTSILQWDQPYVTGAPDSPGASSQLDICMTDETGTVIPGSCSGANPLGGDAVSITQFLTDGVTQAYGIQIGLAGGTPPNKIKVIFGDDGFGTQAFPNFATYSGTVQGHAGAAGAAAVGATPFFANPICLPQLYPTFVLEPFSSAGGDAVLFDNHGVALATPDLRQKPQFVSPDGDATTFFAFPEGEIDSTTPGCANGADSLNFFGTSAAAPHAAGVAALLRQAYPTATPDNIYSAMEHTAVLPMIVFDPATEEPTEEVTTLNYDTGYGFMEAPYAAQNMLIANAGTDQVVGTGNKVTLDSSSSTIPAGAKATYLWTQVSGPTVVLSNAKHANPSFTMTQTKSYVFNVTITLANGQAATSEPVTVTGIGSPGPGGGGAIGLGMLVPGFMLAALRRRRKS